MLTTEIKQQIKEHALKFKEFEVCGLIYQNLLDNNIKIYPCSNTSYEKEHNFSISPAEYLLIIQIGKILASYHSQLENNKFSDVDKRNSYHHNLIYIMYCIKEDSFHIFEPKDYKNPYINY